MKMNEIKDGDDALDGLLRCGTLKVMKINVRCCSTESQTNETNWKLYWRVGAWGALMGEAPCWPLHKHCCSPLSSKKNELPQQLRWLRTDELQRWKHSQHHLGANAFAWNLLSLLMPPPTPSIIMMAFLLCCVAQSDPAIIKVCFQSVRWTRLLLDLLVCASSALFLSASPETVSSLTALCVRKAPRRRRLLT